MGAYTASDNALCDKIKVRPHETIFYVHSYYKLIVNIVLVYKHASHLLDYTGIQTLMYTHKLCVKSHSHEFFNCLDHEFPNQENFC